MVLHKRLDYGSSGYQVPPVPRVPRSARGKRSVRKKVVDKQISAFDLLATVAGELLSERENPPPPSKISGVLNPTTVNSTIKRERHENEIKAEVFDQSSCNESTLGSGSAFKRQVIYNLKEPLQSLKSLEKDAGELTLNNGKRDEIGYALPTISKKCCSEGFSSGLKEDVGVKTPLQAERRMNGNVIDKSVPGILEDPMDLDAKAPALVSSDSSVKVPISRNGTFPVRRNGTFPVRRNGMELVDRDDDENSSGCTHPSANIAKAFRPQRIGDRRIRKLLGSKFWKVPPTALKDGEFPNTDVEIKPVSRSRKVLYTRQRTQRSSFKRRKLLERRSVSASTGGIYGENVPNLPKFRGIKIEAAEAHTILNGANGASSPSSGQKLSSYESGRYHVKFSIKSFKVPELFIEIPETATVGSLKRTVMEAVTAILAGGLRVGVVLQGKKVRDDRQTLLQAGISHNDKMENLGFTLEPNSTQAPPPLTCLEDSNSLAPSNPVLPCASTELVQRIPASVPVPAPAPVLVPAIDQMPLEAAPELPQTSTLNCPESDHDSVHSHTDVSSVDKTASSKALVPVPDMNEDPLNAALLRKSRRSELVQRRIRRPFSVAEVEALVQAVEKLGTGRWRDVKIRAFDNAKHRTYVDLKDKWKTLVHTARISPQQRRGEPVPQELLDRVLSAHAYWTQQQVKPSGAEPCLLI